MAFPMSLVSLIFAADISIRSFCCILFRCQSAVKNPSTGSEHEMKNACLCRRVSARRHFNTANKIMKKVFNAIDSANPKGWHRNTDLAVDLKTELHSDRQMKTGRDYLGVLRRDSDACIEDFRCRDAHYTFTETLPLKEGKRNPHVFRGKYITITRRDDGSLRPNFKPMTVGKDFSPYRYALGVFNELMWALEDLLEK